MLLCQIEYWDAIMPFVYQTVIAEPSHKAAIIRMSHLTQLAYANAKVSCGFGLHPFRIYHNLETFRLKLSAKNSFKKHKKIVIKIHLLSLYFIVAKTR